MRWASLLIFAGCALFDPNEPIQLVPASGWTVQERETLRQAARCWNLRFGIPFEVVDQPSTAQVVRVQFNEFACWGMEGRFTPGQIAQIDVCPIALWGTPDSPAEVRLLTVLAHELGHAAGIRTEGDELDSIMGGGIAVAKTAVYDSTALAFTDEDERLLFEAAPHLATTPSCEGQVVLVDDVETGAACGCKLDGPTSTFYALAYDRARARTVRFGGNVGNQALNTTLVWDGTTWNDPTPASSPPARWGHAMVYDERRERIVLFGGKESTVSWLADTWEFDGATWTNVTPSISPPARSSHMLAYDPDRGRVVLFGGNGGPRTLLGDTWEFDGTTWTEMTSPLSPSPRSSGGFAFDPVRRTIMLFGGDNDDYRADQWAWNGTTWAFIDTVTSPSARTSVAISGTDKIFLFGGQSRGSVHNDLWVWNGSAWTEVITAVGPEERSHHGIAFDFARQHLMVANGGGAWERADDTWEWDGTRWINFSFQQCGDGVLQVGEACDDDNLRPGDGCSATCQLE